jgi:hypothetical protein
MEQNIKELVNADGSLIGGDIPPFIDPKTTAKTTTDKSMRMRAQPFMYTTYRRFFSEGDELIHNAKADEMKDNPEGFHKFLESIGDGNSFEKYFQKDETPEAKLKEVSRSKAYEMMEALLSNRSSNNTEIMRKNPPTIEEIKNKEVLLLDKLTKIAEAIRGVMNEDEKRVIVSYFSHKIK